MHPNYPEVLILFSTSVTAFWAVRVLERDEAMLLTLSLNASFYILVKMQQIKERHNETNI